MGFEPTTSCIRGKRLTTRPRGPHGRERTTHEANIETTKYVFPQRHPPDRLDRVKCEKLFCKTNIKLKSIKIN